IMEKRVDNAFCAVRPPGHHAESGHAMGFCLFNNVAIAARYFQKRYGLERIAIVDWDVHHGNGTQHAFYDDPTVFFFSTHQYPWYPGTGGADERGEGKGEGYTLNVPLSAGMGDKEYLEVFNRILRPALKTYRPDAIIISAGFDAHRDDPLAGMNLTAEGYKALTRVVKEIAAEYARGRVLSCLKAEECGKCHREIYEEWKTSYHAQAFADPFFRAYWRKDGEVWICLNCHTPLANQQPALVTEVPRNRVEKAVTAPNPDYDQALQ